MRLSAWISLALTALIASPALALDASNLPPRVGGPTTLDRLTIVAPGSSGPIDGMCATAPLGSICRTLNDRARDVLSVKDFGAKLDGNTDDTAAYDRARRSVVKPGQRISVPDGTRFTTTTLGGTSPAWWDVMGALSFSGGVPSVTIDDDLTSSVLNGNTRIWARNNSKRSGNPVFRIDRTDNYTSDDISGIGNGLATNCNASGRTDHVYCNATIMHIRSAGSIDHYGLVSVAERMADSPANASSAAALYTELKDSTNQPDSASNGNTGQAMAETDFYTNGTDLNNYHTLIALRIGSYSSDFRAQTTSGSTAIRGFDGLYTAILPGNTLTGSCIPGGTSVVSYNHAAQTAVLSNPATSTGTCNFDLSIVTGEVGNGVDLSASLRGGKVGQGFGVNMPFYAAGFDTSAGTSINNAPAFKMAEGQRFAFDGSGRGKQATYTRFMQYQSGVLSYFTQNGIVFQIDDTGKVNAYSGVTAPVLYMLDTQPPSSTSDPAGVVGEVRFSGSYMYRRTTSGWLRYGGSTF